MTGGSADEGSVGELEEQALRVLAFALGMHHPSWPWFTTPYSARSLAWGRKILSLRLKATANRSIELVIVPWPRGLLQMNY